MDKLLFVIAVMRMRIAVKAFYKWRVLEIVGLTKNMIF